MENKKSPQMTNFLESLCFDLFGTHRGGSIENGSCVVCAQDAASFKDEISEREFGISGMCQTCQDEVFG